MPDGPVWRSRIGNKEMNAVADTSRDSNRLTDRLRQLAQGRDTLDVAQLQFVGLDAIRSAYGERWPQQCERIHDVAQAFLRRRIGPGNLLISADSGFLVVFGAASGFDADTAAAQLSAGLNEFFLGQVCRGPSPQFVAVSQAVAVNDLTRTLAGADFSVSNNESAIAGPVAPSDLEWRFLQAWDVRRETLSKWYVTPYLLKSRERLAGYSFECDALPITTYAAIDEAGLLVSEQAIQKLVAQRKQALIGVSIHVRSMTDLSSRARILSVLDSLDPQLRRFRVLKIAGVAPGFPRLYLNEIVQLLKVRATNIAVVAAWDEPDIAGIIQTRPAAVGLVLPKSIGGPSPAVTLQALTTKLRQHADRTRVAKVRLLVEGEMSSEIARRVAATGVDTVSSACIWPAMHTPDAMLRWPAAHLRA